MRFFSIGVVIEVLIPIIMARLINKKITFGNMATVNKLSELITVTFLYF